MRFRLGLFIGFAVGYVLGSKAGRERYAQLQELWSQVSGSKPAQQISDEVRGAAGRAGHALEEKASEGVTRISALARRDGGDNGGTASGPTAG